MLTDTRGPARTLSPPAPVRPYARALGGPRRATEAVLLCLLALVVRLPSFHRPFWSPDEGYLATQAAMLRNGGHLYEDVVDRKPPLMPWLYEASFTIAGDGGLAAVRVAAVAALGVTAVLTARTAGHLLGAWAALPAGVLTVTASLALPAPDAMAATFEIFMLPATAAAVHFGVKGRFLPAGLAVAVAALTKQVGFAPLLPLLLLALSGPRRRRDTLALTLGAAAPVGICALTLGAHRFTFWVFLSSGPYTTSPPGAQVVAGRAGSGLACLLTAFAAVVLLLPLLPWRRRVHRVRAVRRGLGGTGPATESSRRTDRMLAGWMLASAAAVSVGWHFYGHYFLQLVPPAVLLALRVVDVSGRTASDGPAVLRRLVGRAGRAGTAWCVAACSLLAAAFWTAGAWQARPPQLEKSLAVAAAVREHSAPGQPVLVWGMHPETYWLSGRPPSSRYLTAGLLTNFSGGADVRRVGRAYAVPGTWSVFRRELAHTPPCVLVDDSTGTPYPLADYPELRTLLADGYQRVAEIDGARVYRRDSC
ncbi:glycosyltransferase family 39 protein [Streptomyces aurantiacus]|uniref:glycosyltransferase family 39 protein n=1 Tax=Streptomyces aurantiacus TaxID=47760 RepID=UPI00099EA73B|nr:glycosyltransferase family 39 protein [Streptomyces aurantiacus]